MLQYVDLLSGGEWDDLASERDAVARRGGDPLALKHALASRLVARFHGAGAADGAADRFRRVVQHREVPDDLEERELPLGEAGERGLLELLEALQLVASRGEARRLVVQGAVQVNGERVADPTLRLSRGSYLIKAGRRRFARIRLG